MNLVTAHEPIANHVDYFVRSSKKPDSLPSFNGVGTIHYYLHSASEIFLDLQLSEQTLISGLQFSMPDDKAIKTFSLSVREWGIQFPDQYTYWGLHKLHFGELPTTPGSPIIKTRTAQFQPILGDRLKIFIDEGATELQGALEILGMPFKKVYKADPIFEPRVLESEYFTGEEGNSISLAGQNNKGQNDNINIDMLDSGFCPGGSIFLTTYVNKEYPEDSWGKN